MKKKNVAYKKRVGDSLNRAVDSLLPLAAVPFAVIIGAGLLLLFEVNPLLAYQSLLQGSFGDKIGITQTLVKATPLLLVGLGWSAAIGVAMRIDSVSLDRQHVHAVQFGYKSRTRIVSGSDISKDQESRINCLPL